MNWTDPKVIVLAIVAAIAGFLGMKAGGRGAAKKIEMVAKSARARLGRKTDKAKDEALKNVQKEHDDTVNGDVADWVDDQLGRHPVERPVAPKPNGEPGDDAA